MNRNINILTVKVGKPVSFQGTGKWFKLLRVSPPSLVQVKTDDGQTNNCVQGTQIEFAANIKAGTFTCPGETLDVVVQYYVGDYPFVGSTITEPNSTLLTIDWATIALNGAMKCAGILVVEGTTFRRKSMTVANMTGLPGMNGANPALIAANESAANAFSAFGGPFGLNGGFYPLRASDGTSVFPITVESDDIIYLERNAVAAAIDLSIIQTWLPVIP